MGEEEQQVTMRMNAILGTDSYKVSHWKQYPPLSQHVFSYFESRGGEYPATLFFGLQYYVREVLVPRVTKQDVVDARDIFLQHFNSDEMFNTDGWMHIVEKHRGALPLRVRAVPEGTIVPVSNALLTVENTDPAVPWLTNWVETRLSEMWYPITTATLSRRCRDIILQHLEETGDPLLIDFKLHDFGYRGVSSQESAAIGGLAHLVNFKGTDTVAALMAAREYYQCGMAGFSIPAAEHSTITSWGRENEVDAFRNMLYQFPSGLVAVVSDSFDIYAACEKLWGEVLRNDVLSRPGTLVVRPDSGYPPEVVLNCLEILGCKFGFSVNQKGFKVLDPHVRLIQGDGVDPDMIHKILTYVRARGWSADNVAFGMGGALLQKVNRDTCKFAFKCSAITVNGMERPVFKQPATDPGKNSKQGRLSLYRDVQGRYLTRDTKNPPPAGWTEDVMQTVYLDGMVANQESLDKIRERARNQR